MTDAEITIIGRGAVGLAFDEKVSEEHSNVFLIQKHSSFGQKTSTRNGGIRPEIRKPGEPVRINFYNRNCKKCEKYD